MIWKSFKRKTEKRWTTINKPIVVLLDRVTQCPICPMTFYNKKLHLIIYRLTSGISLLAQDCLNLSYRYGPTYGV